MRVGQELVDPRCWVTIGEVCERYSQPGLRVDAGELAVLDEGGDHRPVVAALVGACEQGVLAVESQRADRALDSVVVEIDATIVEEPDETVPAWKSVADRLAETALGADLPAAGGVSLMRNALRWSDAPVPALHLRP